MPSNLAVCSKEVFSSTEAEPPFAAAFADILGLANRCERLLD